MASPLRDGVYEHLVTRLLERRLQDVAPSTAELATIAAADLPGWLARHLSVEIERALRDAKSSEAQVATAHHLLDQLGALGADAAESAKLVEDAKIAGVARVLRALYRTAAPERPTTPLSSSTLLTRTRAEPSLGHELSREIACADRIEILSAFITTGGVRAVREQLARAARRGVRIRVLTTVFTGTTEVQALDMLSSLEGAEVRVSYDVRRTRLHAKAWLFERDSGLHTAYVGSANMTATALGQGQEWMVKVSAGDLPHVIEKFEGTFEGLWNDPEFEPYDPRSEEDRARLRLALHTEKTSPAATISRFFSLRPHAFQQEILDRLQAERRIHGRFRNLVVAATGTGKTMIAAFDYLSECKSTDARPRLLFLAHRKELLEQALETFRHVLRDGAFGELMVDGRVPERWEYVFASIQSFSNVLGDRIAPDHFPFVIVDECHHAPADSYQRVIRALDPRILVGLTATPERADGKSLLPDFGGRVGAELRLWHALERQLLVPFEYYGISDHTDLRKIKWSRGGYPQAELDAVYTGNHARVDLIVEQLTQRLGDPRGIRALAFCTSVAHAEFMARELSRRGIPAEAVHGETAGPERAAAPELLRTRDVNVLCTCDLYNEGVDLPFVDTLLFLRPTSSATVFVQQLGRGLRLSEGKTTCVVLDFIGQHRKEFRFDVLYAGITGLPRAKLAGAVEEGFPFLPSGCVLQLDEVARTQIVESLRRTVATARALARELTELRGANDHMPLADFLAASGREVEEIYDAGGWTKVREQAGVLADIPTETKTLSESYARILHTDDPAVLALWKPGGILRAAEDVLDRTRVTMLEHQLRPRTVLGDPSEGAPWLTADSIAASELGEVAEILKNRIATANERYPVATWPLALHRHYRRREIVAAVGYVKPGDKGNIPQGGILKLGRERRELLLVTLDKSAASFSPTTRYRDYAISPTLFHWETQAIASVERESGKRYVESPKNGWAFYLFVRTDPKAAYAFLGEARFVSATGDRPIGITWRLEDAMPGALFDRFASLAQG